ncbi:hypothetical protein QR90_10190 [Deinococcus radiopugnans]|uniref:Lipoprotein n=1 Tax=Deinococcus radiopugnans TaxID=57497 RepID=A0A0A7KKB8_9DEIO|nr:hypothetical protein [Deinococcus radiopugnans]AIZ46591.1 hypothetical protein QR90_10190 [Deinococcus radiopugnans]
MIRPVWVKWGLMGGMSLALVACGGAATPQASDQPTVETLNGKVSGWQGEGRVAVPGLPSVSSSVHSDGSFTLTLPPEAELATSVLSAAGITDKLGCSGSVQSSDSEARAYAIMTLDARDSAGRRQTSAITGSKSGLLSRRVNARVWLYSDSLTQLRGTVNCAAVLNMAQIPELPVTVAVNAKPGWNVLELNIDASANVLAQVSASGWLVNSGAGSNQTTFRTVQELQAQVAF